MWVNLVALGYGCGLIDSVVGCSGLLWVEAMGCVVGLRPWVADLSLVGVG